MGPVHFITPSGKASLVDDAEYGWGADVLAVYFTASRESLQSLLPGSLLVDSGLCLAYIGRFHSLSTNRPRATLDNPAGCLYHEAALSIACTHQGRPGFFPAFIWVDREWSLVRGWLNGYPKKIGDVSFARPHPLNPVSGGIQVGALAGGICARHGHMLVQLGIQVEREGGTGDLRSRPATFGHRHWPAMDPTQQGISEIVEVNRSALKVADVWVGRATFELGSAPDEELELFRPMAVEYAVLFSYGFRISGARVIERLPSPTRRETVG